MAAAHVVLLLGCKMLAKLPEVSKLLCPAIVVPAAVTCGISDRNMGCTRGLWVRHVA